MKKGVFYVLSPFFCSYRRLPLEIPRGEESVEEVLTKHERIIKDYCLRTWNAPLPEKKIFREVQSGETIASRPVMQHLISLIQEKEVEAVLVVDLQCITRGDLLDVGELSRLFLYSGCKILTPTKSWDLRDEYDKRFFEKELMHGNDYLEYIKKINVFPSSNILQEERT